MEHTIGIDGTPTGIAKHLHVRGAYATAPSTGSGVMETSPRAWSIRLPLATCHAVFGNISTCVEHTLGVEGKSALLEKHLHVRGAYEGEDALRQLEEKHLHVRGAYFSTLV